MLIRKNIEPTVEENIINYAKEFEFIITGESKAIEFKIVLLYSQINKADTIKKRFQYAEIIPKSTSSKVYTCREIEDLVEDCQFVIEEKEKDFCFTDEEADKIDKVIDDFLQENEIRI